MTAHRTKLAQQPPTEWHITEDSETEEYALVSERLDRSTARIETFIPRGYLIAALFAFAPILPGGNSNTFPAGHHTRCDLVCLYFLAKIYIRCFPRIGGLCRVAKY